MRRSALGYNFYVNPFSSRAADVFHYFAYIISATIVLPTWILTAGFSLKRVSVALRHAEASANVGGRVLEKMRMRRRQSLVSRGRDE